MPLEFHAEVQKTYSLLVSIAILWSRAWAIVLGLFSAADGRLSGCCKASRRRRTGVPAH